jgi:hypothetical protein
MRVSSTRIVIHTVSLELQSSYEDDQRSLSSDSSNLRPRNEINDFNDAKLC